MVDARAIGPDGVLNPDETLLTQMPSRPHLGVRPIELLGAPKPGRPSGHVFVAKPTSMLASLTADIVISAYHLPLLWPVTERTAPFVLVVTTVLPVPLTA